MQVFKTRAFGRYARKERIGDAALCEAVGRADRGIIDADLGGHVIKQRVVRPGQGRSGGYRTLIAYRSQSRAVFIHGFAKNEQDNISARDLVELRKAAAQMLSWDDGDVAALLADGKWMEVDSDDQDVQEQGSGVGA